MKSRSLLPLLIWCVVLPAVAYGAFFAGLRWSDSSRKAVVEDHARWVARYWTKNADLHAICADINREQNLSILKEEWEIGNDTEIIRGPVIDGMRIYIAEGKAIHWRAAK